MSCVSKRIQARAGLVAAVLLVALAASSCGFHRKPYENPITKDTQQPDKVLYDKAINDIEHGRYEVARLTLNTLINTYDSSEFLAKAKLAIADSWYREGTTTARAQAEAEYKDFILFYPTMEEAAESQEKICTIHYDEMDKADRDPNNALRAEQECRQLMVQFPNSKYAPIAEQRLRDIQEVLGEAEMVAGVFYHHKGSNAAAANRFKGLVEQYPLYSRADEALWLDADSLTHMGPRFRQSAGDAYTKIVRDYPLSLWASQAKKKLVEMELPVPEPDPAAMTRMRHEEENYVKPGMRARAASFLGHSPDVSAAAKSGTPTMTNPKAEIPASVPIPGGTSGFSGDVTVAPVGDTSALDTKPDARTGGTGVAGTAAPGAAPAAAGTAATTSPGVPAAANSTTGAASTKPAAASTTPSVDPKSKKKKDKKKKNDSSAASTSTQATPATTPATLSN
jgi:outer membrane protein assembly factor BamD